MSWKHLQHYSILVKNSFISMIAAQIRRRLRSMKTPGTSGIDLRISNCVPKVVAPIHCHRHVYIYCHTMHCYHARGLQSVGRQGSFRGKEWRKQCHFHRHHGWTHADRTGGHCPVDTVSIVPQTSIRRDPASEVRRFLLGGLCHV